MKANSDAKIGDMKATLAIKSTSKSKIENNIFQIHCLFFFQLHTETKIFGYRDNPTPIEKEDTVLSCV